MKLTKKEAREVSHLAHQLNLSFKNAAIKYAKIKNKRALKQLVILTEDDVRNLLTSALEGGSNYWYDVGNTSAERVDQATPEMLGQPFVDRLYAALEKGVKVNIYDANECDVPKRTKLGTLTEYSWAKAERLMIQHHRRQLGEVLLGDDDASTGDVFFQLAVMGKIIFA